MKKMIMSFAALMILMAVGCSMPTIEYPTEYEFIQTATYRVSGTCTEASAITIYNEDGNIQQWTNENLPWEISWDDYDLMNDWLYVSAQNGTNSGTITVEIIVGGSVVESTTSYGGYAIATAER